MFALLAYSAYSVRRHPTSLRQQQQQDLLRHTYEEHAVQLVPALHACIPVKLF